MTVVGIELNLYSLCHAKFIIYILKNIILWTPARPFFSCSLAKPFCYTHVHLLMKTPAVILNTVFSSSRRRHCGKKLRTKKAVFKLCASLVSSTLFILQFMWLKSLLKKGIKVIVICNYVGEHALGKTSNSLCDTNVGNTMMKRKSFTTRHYPINQFAVRRKIDFVMIWFLKQK